MNYRLWEDKGHPVIARWQNDFIFNRYNDDLAIACTGVGCGKTCSLAIWIVHQCIDKPGIKGLIVAQSFGALEKVLVPEIVAFCSYLGINPYVKDRGKEIKFSNGSVLYGFSAENPNAVLGMSEVALLAIDEAAYCNEDIYNYCCDRMRGSKYKPMVRLISSPSVLGRVENWFSKLCKKYPNNVVHATVLDSVDLVGPQFLQKLKDRYGEGTNIYRQQVLGEIFDTDIASQIIFRSEFPTFKRDDNSGLYFLGYDAAGLGADFNEIVVVDKCGMVDYKEMREADTFQIVDAISTYHGKFNIQNMFADGTGGYSKGPCDVAKDKGLDITGINFAQKAFDFNTYPNARTEMYLELAKAVKQGFWVNDIVKEEMLAQAVTINGRGLQALVPKEDVKKVLGHSPDLCDAVALAVYAMNHTDPIPGKMSQKEMDKVAEEYLAWHDYL